LGLGTLLPDKQSGVHRAGIIMRIAMEYLKYICEFFFGNFWHFCGLVIVLAIIFNPGFSVLRINRKNEKD